jgi:small subunit ribosomal protein S27Ae|tara:strand:- start:437 stop:718 length:282 start_codon:yes stop_codon:yes gene_type:complete
MEGKTMSEKPTIEAEKVEKTSADIEPVKKSPKERLMKKKKFSPQIWKFYKIDGDKLQKLKKDCPRCGKGVVLANHKDRETCGKCGYTQFKKID